MEKFRLPRKKKKIFKKLASKIHFNSYLGSFIMRNIDKEGFLIKPKNIKRYKRECE